MAKHIGEQTIYFYNPPIIISTASVVGQKEGEGPLGADFDIILNDSLAGQDSWETAETQMSIDTISQLLSKTSLQATDIDYFLAGDLLNQNVASAFSARDLGRPFLGLFTACATFGEALAVGSVFLESDCANRVIASASSHFCAAEKQFRYPLEFGTQRPPTTSWTVTGCGAALLAKSGEGPKITYATIGKLIDLGIKDPNNMGAAMAPAAVDTIKRHLSDTKRNANYYDLIVTGDLGHYGRKIVEQLLSEQSIYVSSNYIDCGMEIFDQKTQDTHAGGSGCGCCAVTFSGTIYKKLLKKELNKILFVPTGALFNPTSTMQGESIPGIAHAIAIENE